jgi:uncharacterized membrane protein YhaH (DUF805 family)
MGFGEAVSSCFSKYANFSGRAPRSEYWWWVLFVILVSFGVGLISGFLEVASGNKAIGNLVIGLLDLFFLLPNLSVAVRRLHDLNRSGWWYGALLILGLFTLAIFVPVLIRMGMNHDQGLDEMTGINPAVFIVIGILGLIEGIFGLVMLFWFCRRGTRGPNRFGADPLGGI